MLLAVSHYMCKSNKKQLASRKAERVNSAHFNPSLATQQKEGAPQICRTCRKLFFPAQKPAVACARELIVCSPFLTLPKHKLLKRTQTDVTDRRDPGYENRPKYEKQSRHTLSYIVKPLLFIL